MAADFKILGVSGNEMLAGAGTMTSLISKLMESKATMEEFQALAAENERRSFELAARARINNEIAFRQSRQVEGRQMAAIGSQGKGFSASNLIQLQDTANKLARSVDNVNRETNFQLETMRRELTFAGERARNQIIGNTIQSLQIGAQGVFNVLQNRPGEEKLSDTQVKNLEGALGNLSDIQGDNFSKRGISDIEFPEHDNITNQRNRNTLGVRDFSPSILSGGRKPKFLKL